MIKKFFLTVGTSVAILPLNAISGIMTARLLGPSGKGELTAVTLWPGVIAAVGSLGLFEAIIYYVGKSDHQDISRILGSGIFIGIIQSIVLITTGYWLVPLLMDQYTPSVVAIARLYLLFIPLNLLTQYLISIFQGRLLMKQYNLTRFLVVGSFVFFLLLLWVFETVSLLSIVIALLGSNFLILVYEITSLKKLGLLRVRISRRIMKKMLSYGIKSHPGNLSSMLNLRLDQMIMASVLEPALLGLYVVAVTMSGGANLVSHAIASLVFPVLSSTDERDLQRVRLSRFLRFNLWGSSLAALALVALTPWLLPILFGQSYQASVPVAQVLIVAAVVSGMNAVLTYALKGLGCPLVSTYSEMIGLVLTAGGLVILLPSLKIMGAALVSLLAYSTSFLYLFFYSRRKLGLRLSDICLPQAEDFRFLRALFGKANAYSKAALGKLSG